MYRIGLILEPTSAYALRVLGAIRRYAASRSDWRLVTVGAISLHDYEPLPDDLNGLIVHTVDAGVVSRAAAGLPVVSIVADDAAVGCAEIGVVSSDDRLIVEAAMGHFDERLIHHFGYLGSAGFGFAERRRVAMREAAAARGRPLHDLMTQLTGRRGHPTGVSAKNINEQLATWLGDLPPSTGVLCSHDKAAVWLLDVARSIGIEVPHDVAVIGVDDDPFFCEATGPTITSVRHAAAEIGRRAGAAMSEMMAGRMPAERVQMIGPERVVVRESSTTVGTDDEVLAGAMGYMEQRVCEGISINDVLDHLGVSRRTLEYRFRDFLNTTPHAHLRTLRLREARRLLEETELSITDVAYRCGYGSLERFTVAFKKETGMTATRYRRRRLVGRV